MLSTSRRIAAPADRVWRLLVEVEHWPRWGPTVAGAELGTAAIADGSRGRVRTAAGFSLPFEVTTFVPGRRWAWTVAGVPATAHEVRPVDGGCEVTFSVPVWAPAYLVVCALALRRIEALALAEAG